MTADPSKLKKIKEHSIPGVYFAGARVPQTSRLYCGCSDFHVYEIDAGADKLEAIPFSGEGHQSYITGVALTSGGVVSGSYDGKLIWWDAEKREQMRAVDAHGKWIRRVTVSPDGKTVASVADDMVCKLWDAQSGSLLQTLVEHKPMTPNHYPSMLHAVTISPDGWFMATGDKTGHVAVWDFATAKKIAEVETPVMYTWDPKARRHSIGGIRSLAFSHDSTLLAVGGIGKIGNIDHLGGPSRIEIFDWKTGKRLHELEDNKFKGLIEQLEFHESGEWFLAAGGDHGGFVSFYDTKTGKLIKQEKAPMHVHEFAFNESADTLYTVGHQKVAVWELKSGEPAVAQKPAG